VPQLALVAALLKISFISWVVISIQPTNLLGFPGALHLSADKAVLRTVMGQLARSLGRPGVATRTIILSGPRNNDLRCLKVESVYLLTAGVAYEQK
jgi:hypothetical protein